MSNMLCQEAGYEGGEFFTPSDKEMNIKFDTMVDNPTDQYCDGLEEEFFRECSNLRFNPDTQCKQPVAIKCYPFGYIKPAC